MEHSLLIPMRHNDEENNDDGYRRRYKIHSRSEKCLVRSVNRFDCLCILEIINFIEAEMTKANIDLERDLKSELENT